MRQIVLDRARRAAALGALFFISVLAGSVELRAAEQVCVVCTAPEAQYSCSLQPREDGDASLGLSGARLKVRCIREIAETFGHQMCKVSDTVIAACPGTVHMVTTKPSPPVASTPSAQAGGGPPPSATTQAGSAEGAPKTVVEMAKRTAGETTEQLEKSGEVVERAARQTWRCVTSLFTACDENGQRATPPAAAGDQ